MLKVLLKKQFAEIFKSYFVNQKTGKARSKAAVIGYSVLFAFVMLLMCVIFFCMNLLLKDLLKIPDYEWVFFAVMGIAAIMFGLLGSVFNTYASLYLAGDNEMLLAMPIPIKYLLLSRFSGVFVLSLIYSSSVTIPTLISFIIFGKPTVLAIVFGILLIPIIALFCSVLSCILGFFVALISSKFKRKSFITVILSFAFIGVYYFFCFKMSDIFKAIVNNSKSVGKGIKLYGNLLYQLGKASTGDVLSFVIFTAVTLALSALCFFVLCKTYIKIALINKGEKKTVYKRTAEKQMSVEKALLRKEIKRFTSSATYMLNCGLGIIIMPVATVVLLVKRNSILAFAELIKAESPKLYNLLPIAVLALVIIMASMGNIATPSVSLEGKKLWICKSLPLDSYKILRAKMNLHTVFMAPPAVLSAAIISFALKIELINVILISATVYISVVLNATLGVILGLLKPNFDWVSETTPIKQSITVLISMLIGIILPIAVFALGYFLRNSITTQNYLIAVLVVLAIISRYFGNWVKNKGTEIFNNI
ncbi:MAG: hypothetical protein MJ090_02680 [Clostridia bacterium]|nr:hypothetical protein [Clostridia bacterium]